MGLTPAPMLMNCQGQLCHRQIALDARESSTMPHAYVWAHLLCAHAHPTQKCPGPTPYSPNDHVYSRCSRDHPPPAL